jgi:hypothetical protein
MDRVFKFDLIKLEQEERYFFRFYSSNDTHASSREFDSELAAVDWLNLQIMRASGSNEILPL